MNRVVTYDVCTSPDLPIHIHFFSFLPLRQFIPHNTNPDSNYMSIRTVPLGLETRTIEFVQRKPSSVPRPAQLPPLRR